MTDSTTQTKSVDAEASLEQRFRDGADTAFDEVVESYLPSVQQLAYRLAAWDAEVEDIVQDVFTAAFTNRRSFRSGSSLKTWLFAITINTCRSRNRRRLLWQRFVKKQPIYSSSPVDNPARNSLEREQVEKVQSAARRLPAKYRDVIVLKYLEELSTNQILEILNISERAFYTRLSRARNCLQEDLFNYVENNNG
jgi:RNA polymerase sigma-70 factor (ECF subfamily)